MGTRARIGIYNDDGNITSIYTHWDGQPRHHGPILINHYCDEARLRQLLELGDLSSLRSQLGEQHRFEDRSDHPDWCTAFGRDRDDEDVDAECSAILEDFIQLAYVCNAEYVYLYEPGALPHQGWRVAELSCDQEGLIWKDLAVVCEEAAI